MTTADILAEAAKLAATAPRAERLPPRSELDWKIDDAWHRMRFADNSDSRIAWARHHVAARRDRGDFTAVIQGPVSAELEDALARYEAQAAIQNLDGERHD